MTHPAIDEHAVAALRDATDEPGTSIVLRQPEPTPPKPSPLARIKASARKAAVPVIARLRQELDRAGAEDLAGLRAEVASLREELARAKADHAADLAALHEELASQQGRRSPT